MRVVSRKQVFKMCNKLADKLEKAEVYPTVVIGISRGGIVPAMILAETLHCGLAIVSAKRYDKNDKGGYYVSNKQIAFHRKFSRDDVILLVDEIVDDGDTLLETEAWLKEKLKHNDIYKACLYIKTYLSDLFFYDYIDKKKWVTFYWEVGE